MEKKDYFNRSEMINYVMNIVKDYNNRTETRCIAWDFLCDGNKFIDYMINSTPGDEFYIFIRKSGLESGSEEYCQQRCLILGNPIMTICIKYLPYGHESGREYQVTSVSCDL